MKSRADKTAYRVIRSKQEQVLGKSIPFTIDPIQDDLTSRVLSGTPRIDRLSDTVTTPSVKISLADTLAIAMVRNRDYQSRKESLYSAALDLAKTRRDYGIERDPDLSATGDVTRVESGHGTPAGSVVERSKTIAGKFSMEVRKKLFTGATITANFAHSLAREYSEIPSRSATSELSFSVLQPLLHGAGPLVAMEPLRQTERSMTYRVREFKRYQQSFVIDIASSYYNILQAKDQLDNEWQNYQNAILSSEETGMRAEAGLLPMFSVDQAQLRELQAADRYNTAQTDYLSKLDSFKFNVGIPIDIDVGPDPGDFLALQGQDPVMPDISTSEAVETALDNRLDFKTSADQVEDARRAARIALRDFLPKLDLSYDYSAAKTKDTLGVDLDFRNHTRGWKLDLGTPFEWTVCRNAYRSSLISLAQAERSHESDRESLILEVQDSLRTLEQYRKSYEIQKKSLKLSERSVERLQLQIESGEARTRDLLDAQDDLLNARNALSSTLVSQIIQRLRFYNTIERLEIDPRGMWYEMDKSSATQDPDAANAGPEPAPTGDPATGETPSGPEAPVGESVEEVTKQ